MRAINGYGNQTENEKTEEFSKQWKWASRNGRNQQYGFLDLGFQGGNREGMETGLQKPQKPKGVMNGNQVGWVFENPKTH